MRKLIRFGLLILVIVLCVKWCSGCGEGVKAAGIEAGKAVTEVVAATLDKEVTIEVSDDPYDILYGDNQEAETFTLREKLIAGREAIKEASN